MRLNIILLVVYMINLVYAQSDVFDDDDTTLAPRLTQTEACQLSNGEAGLCVERLYCRTPITKVVQWRQNRPCTFGECCILSDVISTNTNEVSPQTPNQGGANGVSPPTPNQGGTNGVGPQPPNLGGTNGVGPQPPNQGGTNGVGQQPPNLGGTNGVGPQPPNLGGSNGVGPQPPNLGGTNGVGPQTPSGQLTCGFQKRQTVQGFVKTKANEADPGEFPWTVNILLFKGLQGSRGSYTYVGTGSLIHNQVVLTAAHFLNNIDATNLRVIYGDHDQGKRVLLKNHVGVSEVAIHSNFNNGNADYNFALVFLKTPVLMLSHVGTVCLPPANYVATAGTTCMISGWGKDSAGQSQKQLTKTVVPAVDHSVCEERLRLDHKLGPGFQLLPSLNCAGGEEGKDICGGAGGSPLVCPIEGQPNRFVQTGIVSWVTEACGVDGAPGVFADVATARSWIDQQMNMRRYSTDSYTYPPF